MARSRSSSGCERKSPKISGGSFKESGNSLRRFGQSIKRIVREVEEQSQVSETRDVLVTRNVLVSRATKHLNQCYLETLNTMVTLQNQYLQSKNEKNIFQRYNQLRSMIKSLNGSKPQSCPLSVEQTLSKLSLRSRPKQSSPSPRTRKTGESLKRDLLISEENKVIVSDLYRLIKKYQAIRTIVRILVDDRQDLDVIKDDVFRRNTMTVNSIRSCQDMVKDATHHPDYKVPTEVIERQLRAPLLFQEYCHEATVELV